MISLYITGIRYVEHLTKNIELGIIELKNENVTKGRGLIFILLAH